MPRSEFLTYPPQEILAKDYTDYSKHTMHSDEIYIEAQASSAIEGLYDFQSIKENQAAITYLVSVQKLDESAILDAHLVLMGRHPDKFPGAYRSHNVRVGYYIAPEYFAVPGLMQEFMQFLQRQDISPTVKAGWAHAWFEHIHPFADGNGRVGRAIVSAILKRPWAPSVLANRDYYYDQLGFASPSGWMAWFEETIQNA